MPVYNETASGGWLFGGFRILVQIDEACPCNSYQLTTSGGLAFAGANTLPKLLEGGGLTWGGAASYTVPTDPWDDTVAAYMLDGSYVGTANEVLDHSRHAFHGRGGNGATANCPSEASGVFCRASQAFNRVNFLSLPQDDLRANEAFTVTLWANITDAYNGRTLFSRGMTTPAGARWVFSLGYNFLRQLVASCVLSDGTEVDAEGVTFLNQGQWYHLSAIFTPGANLSVWVDGGLDGSTSTTGKSLYTATNGNQIGRLDTGSCPLASVQDVRIYPVAKTAGWLEAEFNCLCDASFVRIGPETEV